MAVGVANGARLKRTDRSAATLDERTGGLGTDDTLTSMAASGEAAQQGRWDVGRAGVYEGEVGRPRTGLGGWRHGGLLQKSTTTSNALREGVAKKHGRGGGEQCMYTGGPALVAITLFRAGPPRLSPYCTRTLDHVRRSPVRFASRHPPASPSSGVDG